MSRSELPSVFVDRLSSILPEGVYSSVQETFSFPDTFSFRVNTLKSDPREALSTLTQDGVSVESLSVGDHAYLYQGADPVGLAAHPFFTKGVLYRQAPSSLLPVTVLDPKPGDEVLDACAAPGSKTSQMAARMNDQGRILAVETVKGRYYKLRAVCDLLGVSNVNFKLADMRRLRFPEPVFDKVLVDAPCSSEGRFKLGQPKTLAYWSERKIKEMAHKQKGILLNAARALKPGGELVYSTCTFAPEENEGVVDWFLRKTDGALRLEPFDLPGVGRYPTLPAWKKKVYKNDLSACWRVLPDKVFGGFFIARFVRSFADKG